MTKVIHIKDTPKGYKTNNQYVYIGRAGKGESGYFGNPFSLKDCLDREDCLEKFKKYFYVRIDNDKEYLERVLELKNKTLVCFCSPQSCHGGIISEFLNKRATDEKINNVPVIIN